MSSLPYTTTIPAAGNDPADDQPLMQTNYASINTLIGVDHVSFAGPGYGEHEQVTFNNKNTPSTPTDPVSVLSTASGTASSVSQLTYTTQNAVLPLSCVRAFGLANGGGIVSSQSFNVSSVVRTGAGTYVVTLVANAVSSANFAVLVSGNVATSFNAGQIAGYEITGVGTFQLNFRGFTGTFGVDPTTFSFIVLQI